MALIEEDETDDRAAEMYIKTQGYEVPLVDIALVAGFPYD
jgi:hypothetical protein